MGKNESDFKMILDRLVREGQVSVVNEPLRQVRVIYKGDNLVSGWLPVLQQPFATVEVESDGGHDHTVSGDTSTALEHNHAVALTTSTELNHDHKGSRTTYWMPRVRDRVVVLSLPVFNGDGYVIGVV